MYKANKFNLIELLVVVIILGILFTFSVDKISSISQRAQVTKVQTDLHSISAAILNYKREYGELPYIGANDNNVDYPTGDMSVNFSDILEVLRGENKRGIDFLNRDIVGLFSTGGEESYENYNYQLALDYDGDGEIDFTVFADVAYPVIEGDQDTSIAVWSRNPSEDSPDIRSWVDLARNANSVPGSGSGDDPSVDGSSDPTGGSDDPSDDCTCERTNRGHGNNLDGYDSDNKGNKTIPDGADPDNQTDECGCDNDEKAKGNSGK